jgi:N-acetylglucosamine-6-phosphate deacetylase
MGVYDRKGSIQYGKDADIMMFDSNLNLINVIQMGRDVEVAQSEL